ncbi:hypothetical protein KL951_003021 [Ogataea haglerorum]|uniref:Uncharacterized protein n=1 Tax=Ogataea haglerorum TaxID=1937702 RepID=A0ABQ7RI09_9ASCO|nr:hypothetical protein KL951_003021 [Ogataea haglerorum]KAG7765932.1 hypothetical protein KL946_002112 [Ogataea haglerorum]KAG7787262.1 hypothetical protein KL945_002921 [Ogataea haglerorum]
MSQLLLQLPFELQQAVLEYAGSMVLVQLLSHPTLHGPAFQALRKGIVLTPQETKRSDMGKVDMSILSGSSDYARLKRYIKANRVSLMYVEIYWKLDLSKIEFVLENTAGIKIGCSYLEELFVFRNGKYLDKVRSLKGLILCFGLSKLNTSRDVLTRLTHLSEIDICTSSTMYHSKEYERILETIICLNPSIETVKLRIDTLISTPLPAYLQTVSKMKIKKHISINMKDRSLLGAASERSGATIFNSIFSAIRTIGLDSIYELDLSLKEELDASHPDLSWLDKMHSLKSLSIKVVGDKAQSCDYVIGLQSRFLTSLAISGVLLTQSGIGFGRLENLKALTFSNCTFSTTASDLLNTGLPKHLENLCLTNCKLDWHAVTFPAQLGRVCILNSRLIEFSTAVRSRFNIVPLLSEFIKIYHLDREWTERA